MNKIIDLPEETQKFYDNLKEREVFHVEHSFKTCEKCGTKNPLNNMYCYECEHSFKLPEESGMDLFIKMLENYVGM